MPLNLAENTSYFNGFLKVLPIYDGELGGPLKNNNSALVKCHQISALLQQQKQSYRPSQN